ncbi:MAG TPA: carbohydrate ABC transporter permease [Chloroflexia bacterium]|nr:carbohydrate ABC transporter permease [Chloroflexia bacterium]
MLKSRSLGNQKILGYLPRYVIGVIISLVVLIPLVTTVLGGFKTNGELQNAPFSLPQEFRLDNYNAVLNGTTFWGQILNSTIVMVATVAIILLVSSLAAFIFARMAFPGRELLFNFFTLGMLFPLTVAVLPLYITLRQSSLLDNLLGVILPQVAFSLPVAIFILRGFFRTIPVELEDAAYIDGCNTFGFFWRILLPLSRPALATIGVLNLVGSWNNFLLPLLVLNKSELWTLPLGVMQYQGQYGANWAAIMAFVTLSMIPAIVFYFLAERQLVAGLTAGAVKG